MKANNKSPKVTADKVVRSICTVCPDSDGILVYVTDGRITSIKGDIEHPCTRGHICIKGTNACDLLYHPDRITHPMVRDNQGWHRVSWDDALELIADRLQEVKERYGPLAICGADCFEASPSGVVMALFIRSLGSPNTMHNLDLCAGPGVIADAVTVGENISTYFSVADFRNSKCILLAGTNISATMPGRWKDTIEAIADGAKLIVIDPRRTECVEKADIWLKVRPGSDGALAMGMLNVIINEKLYDEQFVAEWCVGFDQLKQRVQQYAPETVEGITWVPADDIRKAARLFAETKPACLRANIGVLHHNNSTQSGRAFAILASIMGNIDIPGGNLSTAGLKGLKSGMDITGERRLPRHIEEKQLGAQQFPLWSGPDSIIGGAVHNPTVLRAMATGEPYPVKAMLLIRSNILVAYPDTKKVLEALKSLEFFVICAYTMSPNAELADVILPRAHSFEVNRLIACPCGQWVSAAEKAVEPAEDCWDDIRIFSELTKRMKQKGYIDDSFIPWKDQQEFIDDSLKDTGITFEDLKQGGVITVPLTYRKYKESGFRTPSGKVELYSSLLEKYGYDPLPGYQEPPNSEIANPHLAEKYPLMLIATRQHSHYLTRFPEYSWVRNLTPYPQLAIHPETAQERGIVEGDLVWIETPKGRCKHKAKVTENIHPKVVNGSFGWWLPEKPDPEHGCLEVNVNAVMSYDPPYDPVVGINNVQGVLCEVCKAEE